MKHIYSYIFIHVPEAECCISFGSYFILFVFRILLQQVHNFQLRIFKKKHSLGRLCLLT